ncbi:MAG: hypothetical protein ACI4II_02715 [Acutalibacteraceae bacterium]
MKKAISLLLTVLLAVFSASCKQQTEQEQPQDETKIAVQTPDTPAPMIDDYQFAPTEIFEILYTADEALAVCKQNQVVVFEDGKCTYGKDVWNSFYQCVEQGKPSSVICGHYYTLDKDMVSYSLYRQEKDNYPMLYLYLVEYDGNIFNFTCRLSSEKDIEQKESYKYLKHYTGKNGSTHKYKNYDEYMLVDDASVTREQIMSEMLGIWIEGVNTAHHTVYIDYFD